MLPCFTSFVNIFAATIPNETTSKARTNLLIIINVMLLFYGSKFP
jgi:hypothetical protein